MRIHLFALNVIAACWTIFLVVWLVAARSTKRTVYRESRTQRLRYWILLVSAYVVLVNSARLPFPLSARFVPKSDLIDLVGLILCVVGLTFAFWARFTLGRNWSGIVTVKENHELVERGPYRWARHPIYTGLILMLFATVLVLGRIGGLVSLVLAFLSCWIKLRDEEALMLQHFPDRYRAYQHRVKRLIPFVW